jgi:hypothetical protein
VRGETIPTPRGADPASLKSWGVALAGILTRMFAAPVKVESFEVDGLPPAGADRYGAGALVFVTDETDGAALAFSDGTDWRRCTDRAIVS